jgi:glutamine cyclotransferase
MGLHWVLLLWLLSCTAWAESGVPVFVPSINASYPHDASGYTQGLIWHDGLLYESTGRYGHSTLSVRELKTGRILRSRELASEFFAEGLTLVGDELVQLTWKEHRVLIYDKTTLRLKRSLPYEWEGWGIAYDGRHLIVSDGSDLLRFLDPVSFKEVRRIAVQDGAESVDQLNELEYVQGEILANVYGSDRIARISPVDGKVLGWLDLSHLYPEEQRLVSDAVLNGIAYDAERGVLMVTGKYWPRIFLIPAPQNTAPKTTLPYRP